MKPQNNQGYLFAMVLVASSILTSSAFMGEFSALFTVSNSKEDTIEQVSDGEERIADLAKLESDVLPSEDLGLFSTIIQNANEVVSCPNDGTTLAKFFLCGTSDIRNLTLNTSGSTYEWQQLNTGSCAQTVLNDCPTTNSTCVWNTVGSSASYTLSAPGEYRVRVDSGQFYYLKVTQNPLNPQLIFDNVICGNQGRVEITNVPNGYEYSLNSTAGPFQDNPYFDVDSGGDYTVFVRLKNVANSACLFPSNTVTVEEQNINVVASKTDILCSSEFGSIDVSVSGVPGFYTYRLVRNGTTVDTFGPNNSASYSFENVGPGDYSIRVQTNRCSIEVDADSNGDPLLIGGGISPLGATVSASDSFGCGASSVDVTVNARGGTAPYRFSVDGGAFGPTFSATSSFAVNSVGTYNVLVQDANGCEHSAAVDVVDIPPPTFDLSSFDASCGGENTGRVEVNVINGFGYEIDYSIDNGATYQASNVFSGLAAGTYEVLLRYIQETFSCTAPTQSIEVESPGNLSAQPIVNTTPSCGNETGGEINITNVTGGTGPYEYNIGAGFGASPVFPNLGPGTYRPQVRDANGCVQSFTAIVFDAFQKPTNLDFTVSSLDCINNTASITVTPSGGNAPYTYEILSPVANAANNGTNNVFTGLGLGSYTFRVTDSEGCSYDENYALTDISSIRVQAQQVGPVTCLGDNGGGGRFLVDGFSSTYSYSIDGGAVTNAQSNGEIELNSLAAGTYTIDVTDEVTNCTASANLTIDGPTSALSIDDLNLSPMSCQNNNRGSVTVRASGGWGGYRYTLEQPDGSSRGPRSSPTFSSLTQTGDYTVTVTDLNGCSISDTFSLNALTSPDLTINTAASDFCYDAFDAATIAVDATSGQPPYRYRINNGAFDNNSTFSGLTPGNYIIDVYDANNCYDFVRATIRPQITANASIIQELECSGGDAEIRVDIANGYPAGSSYRSYEVSVDGGPFTNDDNPISGNSFVYAIPNDGSITARTSYRFQVSDDQGCTNVSNEVNINPQETISGSITGSTAVCGNNGIITLMADTSTGVPPYQYSNDGGVTFGAQSVFAGYSPGTYGNFMIRDSRGCDSGLLSVSIGSGSPLDATLTSLGATCSGGDVEGGLEASISNGTPPFIYHLLEVDGFTIRNEGPTTNTTVNFDNLQEGDYTLVTTDASGCEDRDTIRLTADGLTITAVPDPLSTCSGDLTNTITINGGVGPFFIRRVEESSVPRYSPNLGPRTHRFDDLDFGTVYRIEVFDLGAGGCVYIEEIPPVAGPSGLSVQLTGSTIPCPAFTATGSLDYSISGSSSSFYEIAVVNIDTQVPVTGYPNNFAATSGTISGLRSGNYQVTVRSLNDDCTDSDVAAVEGYYPRIFVNNNIPATCNAPALVVLSGFGGTEPYTFAYVPIGAGAPDSTTFDANNSFEIVGPYPAEYDFYVQDANGCRSRRRLEITEDVGVTSPVINVVNQCTATSGYQIDVVSPLSTGSGLPKETFQYDIGSGYQDSPNFVVPNPGSYNITVRDGNGCTAVVPADVFDFFAISASATSIPTCNAGDGEITVTTNGGSGNFEFQLRDDNTNLPIGPPQSDPVFSGILPGDYNILVTDLSSNTTPLCTDQAIVEVSTVDAPEISSTPSNNISCHGAGDGSIVVELTPGTDTDTPLEYYLYEGATTNIIAGPQSSNVFDNLNANVYQVEVVSSRGCRDRSLDIPIVEPTLLELNVPDPAYTCNPNSNRFSTAVITVFTDSNGDGTGTGTGTGPYTYSINDGTPAFDGTNFQIDNTFTIIDDGTDRNFEVTVRDQRGCEATATVNILAPSDLTFSFLVNEITCDATGTGVDPGSVEVIIDQGAGNYEVEILPLGSEPVQSSSGTDRVSFPISTPGDYVFAVTDLGGGGCSYLTPIAQVPEYNTIEAVIAEVSPVSCFGARDGEISIEVLNYAGSYNYEVFSRDNTGAESSTGVSGSYDTNNPTATPELIGGLPAGNLIVYIEANETPFCDVASNVTTVRTPDRELTSTLTPTNDVTCNDPGLGEITVAGDGGWGDYEYQLIAPDGTTVLVDFPNTNPIFGGLSAGTYLVNIRDSGGCVFPNSIELNPPDPITASIRVVTPLLCHNDNNAVIEAYDMAGGQGAGNYLFQLNRLIDGSTSGLQTTPVFGNLAEGEYTITVFDGWNCSNATEPITVEDPEIIITELVELQPPGCGDLGRLLLTVSNPEVGVDYFYRRSGTTDTFEPFGAGLVSVEITADINIDPGPFQYDVQNSNGCPSESSNQISLDPAAPLVIDVDLANATINCAGESTGIIRAEAFGGIGNYEYSLLNSNTPPFPDSANTERPMQDSGIFRNLSEGTYFVFSRSGGCEVISDPIIIEPGPPLVLDYLEIVSPSCFGEENGQIIIEASGGTGVIRYSISNTLSEFFEGDDEDFPNRITFSDLSPRQYDIIIQDELGCTITLTETIESPPELVASIASSTPETCIGDGDGQIILNVEGGTPPYYTSINSVNDEDFTLNDEMRFDNLQGGETYVFFVRDSRDCTTDVVATVELGIDIAARPTVQYGCEGIFPNNSVRVDLSENGKLDEVLFSLDDNDVTVASRQRTFGDLTPGDHVVYVYHQNGCVTETSFKIDAYDPLALEFGQVSPNEITVVASGGFGDYEYFFQGENFGSTNSFSSFDTQDINVMVRDRMGCVATLTIPFEFNETPEVPDFFSPNGDDNNDEWGLENGELFPSLEVKIYDRYGRVIATLDNVAKWDGTYEGMPLPTGDYWYELNANDSREQRWFGHFTLFR